MSFLTESVTVQIFGVILLKVLQGSFVLFIEKVQQFEGRRAKQIKL